MFPSENEYFILVVTPSSCFKLDTGFDILSTFGDSGNTGECLIDARMADMDYEGNIYILDRGDNSLKKYDINGVFLQQWTFIGTPKFIDLFADDLYILDDSTDRIDKYNSIGAFKETIIDDPVLNDVTAFRIDKDGEVWVIDNNGKRIIKAFWGNHLSLIETKTDYCYEDRTFDFQELVWVDPGFRSFVTLDKGSQYILIFCLQPVD
jgi:hypothetical protein